MWSDRPAFVILISNELFDIDPDPGTGKQLYIEYEINGAIKILTLNEGEQLLIP
jgi:hypothetical protein